MHHLRIAFFLCIPLHQKTIKPITMKIKLTNEQIKRIVDDPVEAANAKIKVNDPWWIIVIKIISYICGLILAGAATTSCSSMIGLI